jgi:hypothetical protein
MAEKRITFEDIFAEDIFQRAAVSAKALEEVLQSLSKTLKQLSEEDKKVLQGLANAKGTAEDIKKLADATRKAENTVKALSAAEKALEKAQRQVQVVTSAQAKEIFKLKDAAKEAAEELRAQAASERVAAQATELLKKAQEGLFESYFDLSDTLEDLRRVYKDLAAAGKANTEEAQRIIAAINELDRRVKNIDYSVGQFQRNVGNYTGSIREFFFEVSKRAEEGGGALGGMLGFVRSLGPAFRAAGGGLRGLAAAIQLTSRALATSGILLLLQVAGEALGKVASLISNVLGNIAEKLGIITREGVENAKKAIENTRERIKLEAELAEAERKRKEEGETEESVQRVYASKRRLLEFELRNLHEQLRLNRQQQADEEGLLGDAEKRQELLEKQAEIEENIAKTQQELLDLALEEKQVLEQIRKEREEAARRAEEERRARLEALLQEMALEKERSKVRVEAIRQERDERLAQLAAVRALALEVARTEDERLEVERRYAARRAQIIKQAEEQIAEVRLEAANRATELYLQAQKESAEVELAQLGNKYRQLRAELRAQEAELGRELTDTREALAEAETRERVAILRKYALKAVDEQEKLAEQQLDLEARRFEDEKAFQEYKQQELLKIQLRFVRERIKALEELNAQISDEETEMQLRALKAQEALLDLRLRTLTRTAENQAELIRERLRAIANELEKALQLYEALLDRSMQRAEMRLQRQEQAISTRINLLVAQAEQGSIAATESIAQLEQRQAEIAKAQEDLKRKAQQREAALGAFRAYAAQLAQGVNPAQALINTLRDLTVISQFVRSLPTFHEGTEEIRPGMAPFLKNAVQDAYLVRVHQGERIVPAALNAQLRGLTNEELVQRVRGGERVQFAYDSLLDSIVAVVEKSNKRTKIYRAI